MQKCMYCEKTEESFGPNKHIAPESLGNTLILPPGIVCNSCDNYFGRQVEYAAVNHPILSFIRTSLSVKNKKRRYTSFATISSNMHGRASGIPHTVIQREHYQSMINNGGYTQILPTSNLGPVIRMIMKIGLESIASEDIYSVTDPMFVDARQAVRYPRKGQRWPVALSLNVNNPLGLEFGYFILNPGRLFVAFLKYHWASFLVPLTSGEFVTIISNENDHREAPARYRIGEDDISRSKGSSIDVFGSPIVLTFALEQTPPQEWEGDVVSGFLIDATFQ
jgi:hypothetical protein